MAAIDLNLRPDARTLRQFGFIALGAFVLLGAFVRWKGGLFGAHFGAAAEPVAYALIGLGLLAGALAFFAPLANRFLYIGLMLAAYPIGLVVSYVIMGVLFYLLITPLGLLGRLLRRDPLQLRPSPGAKSFWVARKREKSAVARYFQQY